MTGKKTLIKRFLFFVVKLAIFMGLLYIVLKRWWDQPLSLAPLKKVFSKPNTLFYFFSCIFLILPNWLLEAKIWQFLIRKIEATSLYDSLKSVLSGLTLGILTPFMTGDYLGRVLYLPKQKRKHGVGVNLMGSYLFTLLSIHLGTLGLQYYLSNAADWNAPIHPLLSWLLYLLYAMSLGGILLLVCNTASLLVRVKFLKPYLEAIEQFKLTEMLWVYILALIRYAIFIFQFILLFWAFGVKLPVMILLGGILLIFLAKIIGSGFNIFGDLTTRELVGIGYFNIFDVNLGNVTWVIFLLWLLNIIIPALWGFIFISNTKATSING